MKQILLLEDSPDFQLVVQNVLKDKFEIMVAGTISDAIQKLESATYDLFLLDVMLPDGDGFKFCHDLKSNPRVAQIPVIFLTCKNLLLDKVTGFSLGADDYISKPFEPLELLARVEARLRTRQYDPKSVRKGDLLFHVDLQRLAVKKDNEKESDFFLTPIEFRILYFLAQNEGTIFSRDQLLDKIWSKDVKVIEENLYTHMSCIRRKLKNYSSVLENVPRVGYRFNSKPKL